MKRASSGDAEPAVQDAPVFQELTAVRVVPGVLGTPFLLAGAVVLVPGGSKLLSRWAGRSAMRQIGRFLDDLGRRYPHR